MWTRHPGSPPLLPRRGWQPPTLTSTSRLPCRRPLYPRLTSGCNDLLDPELLPPLPSRGTLQFNRRHGALEQDVQPVAQLHILLWVTSGSVWKALETSASSRVAEKFVLRAPLAQIFEKSGNSWPPKDLSNLRKAYVGAQILRDNGDHSSLSGLSSAEISAVLGTATSRQQAGASMHADSELR